MTTQNPFGARLAAIRTQRDMTRMALADAIPVARSTITKWEAGESLPNADHVARLCQVLQVPPKKLLGLEDEELPESTHERTIRLFEAEDWGKATTILRLTPPVIDALKDGRVQLSSASLQRVADTYDVSAAWLKSGNPKDWEPSLDGGVSVRFRFFRIRCGLELPNDIYWISIEKDEVFAAEERDCGRLGNIGNIWIRALGEDPKRMASSAPYDFEWVLTGQISAISADGAVEGKK